MPYLNCPRCRIVVHLSAPLRNPGRCPRCSTQLQQGSVERTREAFPNATERGGGRTGGGGPVR
jgi:hypothetical protein